MYQRLNNDSAALWYILTKLLNAVLLTLCLPMPMSIATYVANSTSRKIADSLRIEEIENNYSDDYNFEPTMWKSMHGSFSFIPFIPTISMTRHYVFLDESEWSDDTLDDDWYDDYDTTMISDELLNIMLENWDSVSVHIPKTDF